MTDAARIAAKIALLAFLVSSMLAAGLSLTPHAILAPLRNLRLVLVALALNFVAAPVFALVLSIVIPLERPHAIGLVLLGGAAGAPFLPKLVEGAHGDLGFAVALMTLLTVGTTLWCSFPPRAGCGGRRRVPRSTNKNTSRFEPLRLRKTGANLRCRTKVNRKLAA